VEPKSYSLIRINTFVDSIDFDDMVPDVGKERTSDIRQMGACEAKSFTWEEWK
jgi:hypothetical protein